jgi:hypothetical protein
MGTGHKRVELQSNAQAKLDDATLLHSGGRHSNAYYLAGYAVEIALKACIAAQFTADTIPDKAFVNAIYDHNLDRLIKIAGLTSELRRKEDSDSDFAANWALVAQWSESARYESTDAITSQYFLQAISDPTSGVFQWIKTFW